MGGVFGLIGFYQIPSLRKWCWVAVLLDYGSVVFLIALPKVARELWQTSRINLVMAFAGENNTKEVIIRLYKTGVFVIRHRISRNEGEVGLVESSDLGRWHKKDGGIVLRLRDDTVSLRQQGSIWKIDQSFSHHIADPDLNVQGLDFRKTHEKGSP
jgi:hypothetical protein